MPSVLPRFEPLLKRAVAHYWRTLNEQSAKQKAGDADRGARAAVTGGKQMDGFCELVHRVLVKNQLPKASIYTRDRLELPGYFRPTKRWDMLVVHEGHLIAALEFKSQRGRHSETTSTTEPRKLLEAQSTYGPLIAKERSEESLALGWDG